MKSESKGIELNIVKGVIGINNVPISSRKIIAGLVHFFHTIIVILDIILTK